MNITSACVPILASNLPRTYHDMAMTKPPPCGTLQRHMLIGLISPNCHILRPIQSQLEHYVHLSAESIPCSVLVLRLSFRSTAVFWSHAYIILVWQTAFSLQDWYASARKHKTHVSQSARLLAVEEWKRAAALRFNCCCRSLTSYHRLGPSSGPSCWKARDS